MAACYSCPRRCGADRQGGEVGHCGAGNTVRIARAALHLWEEPAISGAHGSGTIFFSGCNLRCVYCQNMEVSHRGKGRDVTPAQLEDVMMDLQLQGAHNINLVTPTHYADAIIQALRNVRHKLFIPVIYNCGGYESVDTIDRLGGLVDIYMPDVKYYSSELSRDYSGAADYFTVAREAVLRMQKQVGKPVRDENGMLLRGVLVRHLVLPGCRRDTEEVIRQLRRMFQPDDILLSLMSQYTPDFATDAPYPNLHRRVTTLEYEYACKAVRESGFDGYVQRRTAASAQYTPDFEGELQ